ncbi:MAG: hypothetical protein M1827_002142 [Pycnora praestabilis]|nr:MAG: hypothetical protein M1827_002142 [Pycnora praestabilis]
MDAFHRHREALLNAMTVEYKDYEWELEQSLTQQERVQQEVQEELDILRRRVLSVEVLERENEQLRKKLECQIALQESSSSAAGKGSNSSPQDGGIESDQGREEYQSHASKPYKDYAQLAAKNNALSEKYKTLYKAHQLLSTKYAAREERVDQWKAYAKQVEAQRRKKHVARGRKTDPPIPATTHAVREIIIDDRGCDANTVKQKRTAPCQHQLARSIPSSSGPSMPKVSLSSSLNDDRFVEEEEEEELPDLTHIFHAQHSKPRISPVGRLPYTEKVNLSAEDQQIGHDSPKLPSLMLEGLGADISTIHTNARGSRRLFDGEQHEASKKETIGSSQTTNASIVGDLGLADVATPERLVRVLPQPIAFLSSDPPLVISDRSLKRKRPSRVDTPHPTGDGKAAASGNAIRPIHVKSENISSSPVGVAAFPRHQYTNESLDLDEVGSPVNTPKKRTRMQELGSKPEGHSVPIIDFVNKPQAPTSFLRTRHHSEEPASEGDDDYMKDENQSLSGENGLYDSRYCAGMGERFAANMLLGQETKDVARKEAQEKLDAKVPERFRGSSNQKKARQRLHNQRVSSKRASQLFQITHPESKYSVTLNGASSTAKGVSGLLTRTQPIRIHTDVDRSLSEPRETGASQKHQVEGSELGSDRIVALRPTTSNTRILPRTGELRCKQNRPSPAQRKKQDAAATRIAQIAEDGKEESSGEYHCDPDNTKLEAHRRLGNLLESPSRDKLILRLDEPRPGTSSKLASLRTLKAEQGFPIKERPKRAQKAVSGPETSGLRIFGRGLKVHPIQPISSYSKSKSPNPPSKSLAPHPSGEPFRARPLDRLGLEHFKINPNANQGLPYAFVETIRNHDQRKCLPGCTRPECCGGAFRKMLEIGGPTTTTPQRSHLWNSSSSPVDEEQHLLEDFLGADSPRLSHMTNEERVDCLMQARAKQFADKHGRHRQAFERRKTPPGFWRSEMPTTQEAEGDREEAGVEERRRVEERWREALRVGGKWMFRDE